MEDIYCPKQWRVQSIDVTVHNQCMAHGVIGDRGGQWDRVGGMGQEVTDQMSY